MNDYELTGCPGCGRDIDPEDLCEHDDAETGPLCLDVCCERAHPVGLKLWEVRAA